MFKNMVVNIRKFIFYGMVLPLFLTGCAVLNGKKVYQLYEEDDLAGRQPAIIYLPVQFELDVLDGNDISATLGLVRPEEIALHLKPGKHLLGAYYLDYWKRNEGGEERVESSTSILEFTVEEGKEYRLNMAWPKSYGEAIKLESGYDFWLEEAKSAQVMARSRPMTVAELKAGAQASVSTLSATSSGGLELTPLESLQIWWGRANPNEQKRFREWIENSIK